MIPRALLLAGLAGLFAVVGAAGSIEAAPSSSPAAATFAFDWKGTPATPLPWVPATMNDWDVVVHDRDVAGGKAYPSTMAQHGSNCAAYPASHLVDDMNNAVFICNNHVMTAVNSPGYGEIELTPAQLADWSSGTVRITWQVSTLRTSDRDWWDVNVTPFEENLVTPIDNSVDGEGEPRDHVNCSMSVSIPTTFSCYVRTAFAETELPRKPSRSMEEALGGTTSGVTRTRFELDISANHIRFGMPDQDNWFVDAATSLAFHQGVVQIGHHTYDPDKTSNCPAIGNTGCTGDTWHWSAFSISSAVPFTMMRLSPTTNAPAGGGNQVLVYRLQQPAPSDAYLRFSASGDFIFYSVDGGKTWSRCIEQQASHMNNSSWKNYFVAIPAGTASIRLRGQDLSSGPWLVQDPAVWSLTLLPATAGSNAPLSVASAPPQPALVSRPAQVTSQDPPLEQAYHAVRDWGKRYVVPLAVVALFLAVISALRQSRRSRR